MGLRVCVCCVCVLCRGTGKGEGSREAQSRDCLNFISCCYLFDDRGQLLNFSAQYFPPLCSGRRAGAPTSLGSGEEGERPHDTHTWRVLSKLCGG